MSSPYERPGHPGEFVYLVQVDLSQMFTTLAQIAPPEIYKQIRKTVFGEQEIENPHHPESVAEFERVQREANEILVRYYLTQGVKVDMSDRINEQIDGKINEFRAIFNQPDYEPADRKLFYLEKVFCDTLEDVGNLVSAIHQLAAVGREQALAFAKLFRTQVEWSRYMAQFTPDD